MIRVCARAKGNVYFIMIVNVNTDIKVMNVKLCTVIKLKIVLIQMVTVLDQIYVLVNLDISISLVTLHRVLTFLD